MTAETSSKKDAVQFPLNARLMEESAKIKEERKMIRERLKKIEASKGQVSATVYNKVKSDYAEQMQKNTDRLLEKKNDIDRELSTLYDAKKKVSENVHSHREKVEEIKFRKSLGEFDNEEFHKVADEENEKLGKFEKILAAIESNIKQYESLFEGEDLGGSSPNIEVAPEPPAPHEVKHEPDTEAPVALEEDSYNVGGEGYFSAVTEDVPLPAPEEKTSKEIHAPEGTGNARLVIIEGDEKGKEFVIIQDHVTIGRASSNFVPLKEAKVSRQHASIKKHGNEYLLEDLHSSNGVIVNDEKIKEHVLSDGDVIKIGDFALKFIC